jgi:hypothetical protein
MPVINGIVLSTRPIRACPGNSVALIDDVIVQEHFSPWPIDSPVFKLPAWRWSKESVVSLLRMIRSELMSSRSVTSTFIKTITP